MRRAPALLLLIAACAEPPPPELQGTWASERDASAEVSFDGTTVTVGIRIEGTVRRTVYEQRTEEQGEGRYLLRWTSSDGEELRLEAEVDGDRLRLVLDGEEFRLRRRPG